MPDDLGVGVGFLQVFEQEPEGGLLLGSASVGIAASIVHATNVAYADGVLVVVAYVGSGEFLCTAGVNGAILIDHPVVAAAGPALGLVEVVEVFDGYFLTGFRVGAVKDNPFYFLHRKKFIFFHHIFLLVLEPGWSATLNSDCSQYAGYDGCNEF